MPNSPEARASTYRARMRVDMMRKLAVYLATDPHFSLIVDDAVDEGMFIIEHLLAENEGLRAQLAERDHQEYLRD